MHLFHAAAVAAAAASAATTNVTTAAPTPAPAPWGQAWLRYDPLPPALRASTANNFSTICVESATAAVPPLLNSSVRELQRGLAGLLQLPAPPLVRVAADCAVPVGPTAGGEIILTSAGHAPATKQAEGFVLSPGSCGSRHVACTRITSASDRGVLYGAFAFLRQLQTTDSSGGNNRDSDSVTQVPATALRVWDLWDNVDGSVERGYAGPSVFDWTAIGKGDVSARYEDYARLLASVGINAAAFLNVNACGNGNELLLGTALLADVAVVARAFARWGVDIFLTPCFASPIKVGGLKTADPLDAGVQAWWANTSRYVSELFGAASFRGFLIKADSEGDPGPRTYGRNQSQGANMLAAALRPVNGTVLWRAFEYGGKGDRARQAADTFLPYDLEFADDVVLQVKNGPIDFQAREPVSPLFSAGLRAASGRPLRLMLELQATQEYIGQARALAALAPQWVYYLGFPLAAPAGHTLAAVVTDDDAGAGIAAVSNLGADADWAGNDMAAANTYSFGRLAWDPALGAAAVLREWTAMTWGHDEVVTDEIVSMSLSSWGVFENYSSPMGTFCAGGDHFAPDPEHRNADYINASATGVGYDRTVATGSGFIGQYRASTAALFESLETCPDELLLFMHHVQWNHTLHSGEQLLDFLYTSHASGVAAVANYSQRWAALGGRPGMDAARHTAVAELLAGQLDDAQTWCKAMASFFHAHSGVAPPGGTAAALCDSAPAPPSPSPSPAPSGTAFSKHTGDFCETAGTGARRVYDETGSSLAACRARCAADASCSCFDFCARCRDECRLVEGAGATKPSSEGYDAYTRR